MERQRERRQEAFKQFIKLDLDVEWKIPVKIENIDWSSIPEVYEMYPKYGSQALTLIEIFEEAKRRKVESFMLFEDDIIFHPHASSLLPLISVPDDWKFIYIGGRNCNAKKAVSQGLVKSTFVADLHAVIIRSNMIDFLKQQLLDDTLKTHWADARIAKLHKIYPAYLCRPNLAWQCKHTNDTGVGPSYSNYNEDGTVKAGQGN